MESSELDYRLGNDIYRISVTAVIDLSQGRKMYRSEVVIEKNVSDLDAEETRRVQVGRLFSTAEKAQRHALGHAKKLIEESQPLSVLPEVPAQPSLDP